MTERLLVLGAGGHARVVVSALQDAGRPPQKILDDDSGKWGRKILGIPIDGPIERHGSGADLAIAAFGDNRLRAKKVAESGSRWTTAVHPSAFVHPSASLGEGTVVCAGAVVQPEVVIGAHSIVNTGASVDHDCELGDFAHVAPGARLAGSVRIGAGTLVGIGAVIVPGVVVGEWVRIGAGAAVTGDLPSQCVAVGVPARILETSG